MAPLRVIVSGDTDPRVIRSIALTAEDLVAAVETNLTTDRRAVLRVTPPFSGRMRARLHVVLDEPTDDGPIVVDPERLLAADAPAYPRPAETEDRLRADPDAAYTVERHRRRHERAIEDWRDRIISSVRQVLNLPLDGQTHEVDVYVLGET